jgi:hypothetical protein
VNYSKCHCLFIDRKEEYEPKEMTKPKSRKKSKAGPKTIKIEDQEDQVSVSIKEEQNDNKSSIRKPETPQKIEDSKKASIEEEESKAETPKKKG